MFYSTQIEQCIDNFIIFCFNSNTELFSMIKSHRQLISKIFYNNASIFSNYLDTFDITRKTYNQMSH